LTNPVGVCYNRRGPPFALIFDFALRRLVIKAITLIIVAGFMQVNALLSAETSPARTNFTEPQKKTWQTPLDLVQWRERHHRNSTSLSHWRRGAEMRMILIWDRPALAILECPFFIGQKKIRESPGANADFLECVF